MKLKKEMARIKEENEILHQRWALAKQAILEIYNENKGRYGSPKIHFLMKQKVIKSVKSEFSAL